MLIFDVLLHSLCFFLVVTSAHRGFTNVACDYISIVGAVEGVNGKDVLKAYSFDT